MRRRTVLLGLGALCALGLAACGSSSPGKPTAGTPADNALKFARCMREHGVKGFPDPEVSGGRVSLKFSTKPGSPGAASQQTMDAAQRACRHFQAETQPNLTPQERVAREEAVRKFARCMREHGVEVHASTAGAGVQVHIQGSGGQGGPNPESPAFQSAQKACQGMLPFKGAGPPSTGSTKGPAGAAGLSVGG